jgi:hypothetical protein
MSLATENTVNSEYSRVYWADSTVTAFYKPHKLLTSNEMSGTAIGDKRNMKNREQYEVSNKQEQVQHSMHAARSTLWRHKRYAPPCKS